MYYCLLEEQRESGAVEVGPPMTADCLHCSTQHMQEAAYALECPPTHAWAHDTLGGLRNWEGW